AVLYDGMVISTDPEITVTTDSNYSIGMYVVSDHQIVQDSVRLLYSIDNGTSFTSLPMTLTETVDSSTASGKYSAVIPVKINGVNIQFYAEADDASPKRTTSPANAPSVLYSAKTGATGVETTPRIPRSFVLEQNFPNPFNPATTIRYQIPSADEVSLTVYDVLGKEVAALVNGVQTAGVHTVPFYGTRLSSGVYFYRLRTPSFTETKKMVLIK
ncbi:MAG: T9SS type A sorting domain-containing protein, partial [Bacteroidota bacterium]